MSWDKHLLLRSLGSKLINWCSAIWKGIRAGSTATLRQKREMNCGSRGTAVSPTKSRRKYRVDLLKLDHLNSSRRCQANCLLFWVVRKGLKKKRKENRKENYREEVGHDLNSSRRCQANCLLFWVVKDSNTICIFKPWCLNASMFKRWT